MGETKANTPLPSNGEVEKEVRQENREMAGEQDRSTLSRNEEESLKEEQGEAVEKSSPLVILSEYNNLEDAQIEALLGDAGTVFSGEALRMILAAQHYKYVKLRHEFEDLRSHVYHMLGQP